MATYASPLTKDASQWWQEKAFPACSLVGRPFEALIREVVGTLRFPTGSVIIVLYLPQLKRERLQYAVKIAEDRFQLFGRSLIARLPQSLVEGLVHHHERASEIIGPVKTEGRVLVGQVDTLHSDADLVQQNLGEVMGFLVEALACLLPLALRQHDEAFG